MTRLCWPLTLFFSSSLFHSPRSLLSVSPVHTLCMNTDYRWIWNPLTSFGYCVLIIILCSVSLTLVIQLLCQAINFCFMTGLFASPANVDLFFFPHWTTLNNIGSSFRLFILFSLPLLLALFAVPNETTTANADISLLPIVVAVAAASVLFVASVDRKCSHLLSTMSFLDETRVGIWGWGYGGYVTAMVLGTQQEVYKCGVSVSPITDWLFYSK